MGSLVLARASRTINVGPQMRTPKTNQGLQHLVGASNKIWYLQHQLGWQHWPGSPVLAGTLSAM